MECNIKIVKLKQVLPLGTFPKREHNVRFFYHRTDGCYYMYDEKGCEINLTTDGNLIPIDRELIVGSESLTDDTLVCIGLKANYVHPSSGVRNNTCGCQDTYIKAWTYIKDLHDFLQSGTIERNYYRVSLTPSPEEGGIVGCTGSSILPDESSDGFRFQFEAGSKVKLYAKPVPGYHFLGWKEYHSNEIMSISPDWTFTIKKDMDLIGVFEKEGSPVNNFYINVDAYPATAGYVVGAGTFPKGTRHSITAAAIDGYHFVCWKNSKNILVSTQLQYDLIVEADETYTAYFELDTKPTYMVSVNATPSDKGSVSGGGNYQKGATAIIKPSPIQGWKVGSVTSSDGNITNNGDGTWSIVVNQDVTVNVTFVESIRYFTFSVVANANGLVRYKDISGSWSSWAEKHEVTAPEKTIVTIEAKPDEGYEFENWISPTGVNLPNNSNNIIVEEGLHRKTYTAYFGSGVPSEYNLSVRCGLGGNVRYKIDDGNWSGYSNNIDGRTAPANSTVYFEAKPDKGYRFKQWKVNGEVDTNISSSTVVTGITRIEGSFEEIPAETHSINILAGPNGRCQYKLNGGSYSEPQSVHDVTVTVGQTLELLAVPNEGYQFDTWKLGTETSKENPCSKTITEDIDISCSFKEVPPEEVTITVKADGTNETRYKIASNEWSNWSASEQTFKCNVGSIYSIEARPKGDFKFIQWTTGDNNTTDNPANFTAQSGLNAVHTASFEAIRRRKLSVRMDGQGQFRYKLGEAEWSQYMGDYSLSDVIEGTNIQLEAKANEGHHFVKWNTDHTDPLISLTLNDDVTYTAHFEENAPDRFEVTYKVIPEGAATMTGAGTYADGDTCHISIDVDSDYTLDEVLVDGVKVPIEDGGTYDFVVEKNVVVTIKCTAIPEYTITAKTENGNTSQGGVGIDANTNLATKSVTVKDGSKVTLYATAAEKYKFIGWYKGNSKVSDSNQYQVTATENATYVAKFEALPPSKYTVTYSANPSGSATMDGAKTYNDGDTCIITVHVNNGYTLDNVQVDGITVPLNGQNQYSFVVEKNIHVTINCTAIPDYTITIETEDRSTTQGSVGFTSAAGKAKDTKTARVGTSVTMYAVAAASYHFAGWFKDSTKVSSDANYTIKASANVEYIAKFEKDPYLELDQTSLEFEAEGGTKTVKVTSNVNWTVS